MQPLNAFIIDVTKFLALAIEMFLYTEWEKIVDMKDLLQNIFMSTGRVLH